MGEAQYIAASAGMLAKWAPPWCEMLEIHADSDEPGQQAATKLAHMVKQASKQVHIFAPAGVKDFNDLLRKDGIAAVCAMVGCGPPKVVTSSETDAESSEAPTGDVFRETPTAREFCAETGDAENPIIGGLIVRSGASLLASPRGLGKTILAMRLAIAFANGQEFCRHTMPQSRVLYCAYENSPAVLRERLRKLGGAESDNLHLLTRSKAPRLQSKEWEAFPVEDYDFIFIDSLGPAMEGGIDERQGGQNSDALAALLDLCQRGPGALLIANTTKTASSIRGSGVLSDRADLVFEVRDATDFKPRPKDEVWWDSLSENQGESAWANRAKRRRGKTTFRLALIASKTRVGPELDPKVLELDLSGDTWTVSDVSAEVAAAHGKSKTAAIEQAQAREGAAIDALKAALPLPRANAEKLLTAHKLSRKAARQILDANIGKLWTVAAAGRTSSAHIYSVINGKLPAATNFNAENELDAPKLAATGGEGRQASMLESASAPIGSQPMLAAQQEIYTGRRNFNDGKLAGRLDPARHPTYSAWRQAGGRTG